MEWKKIRAWLILMVLAVDLFLAGNLLRQGLAVRQHEREAVQDAVAVAQSRGMNIPAEAVMALPEKMTVWQAQRSEQQERAAAQALLGTVQSENPGGGVSIYTGEAGQMIFRRGGAVELDGLWNGTDSMTVADVLLNAGFAVDETLLLQQPDRLEVAQRFEDYPVFNSRLTCRLDNGRLLAEGRWMLAEEPEELGSGRSRAQLVLALCDLLESRQAVPTALQAGYCLLSEDGQSLTLEPVWAAETDQGRLLISCVTGLELNF